MSGGRRAQLGPHDIAPKEPAFIGRGGGEVRDLILAGLRDAEA